MSAESINLVRLAESCRTLTERRLKILVILVSAQRPITVAEIGQLSGMSDALASHHLLALKRAELVHGTQIGKFVAYVPNVPHLDWLADQLKALTSGSGIVALDLGEGEEEDDKDEEEFPDEDR